VLMLTGGGGGHAGVRAEWVAAMSSRVAPSTGRNPMTATVPLEVVSREGNGAAAPVRSPIVSRSMAEAPGPAMMLEPAVPGSGSPLTAAMTTTAGGGGEEKGERWEGSR
jgi:hypothetical protein